MLGAPAYVDSVAGEGADKGEDGLDDRVGEGPAFGDGIKGGKIGFEGGAGSRGDKGPVGTCTDGLKVEVATKGFLRLKIFLKGFAMVKL